MSLCLSPVWSSHTGWHCSNHGRVPKYEFVIPMASYIQRKINPYQVPAYSMMKSKFHIRYEGDLYGSTDKRREIRLSYEQLQSLLTHHNTIEMSARQLLGNDKVSRPDREALQRIQSGHSHLRDNFKEIWSLIPALTHTFTAKAQEVFDIPELFETILSYLIPPDKLVAMRVQRKWRDTILGSVMLQRSLGLVSTREKE